MNKILLTIISISFTVMLLLCWHPDLPYLYFQLLRVIGMIVFTLLAYDSYKRNNIPFALIFGISVLIIQPFVKVPLGRFNWNMVDTVWSFFILINMFLLNKKPH